MATRCPKCQSENSETARFCGNCAAPLQPTEIRGHQPAEIGGHQPDSPDFGVVPRDLKTETLQVPVKELTTGSTFAGRYQIIEELGKGGMGRVYKVFDTDIREKVALKLLKPEIASDRETIERFSNELKYARKISHRNVCRMYDLGKSEGTHFITMEYVQGEDLKSMIRMTGMLGIGTVLSVGKQVCDGLAEAHSLGVVHRDLKPTNIMIDKGGNAKIMDFGIARSLRERGITGPSVLIGTPEYMSPEQAEAKEVDQRSDIYSLGIILYEMATGRVPFEGETALSIAMKHKGEMPKNPKQFNPNIPDDLSGVILKCLEKDRAARYQTAAEVHSELEKIEKGIPTTERVVPEKRTFTSKEITVKFNLKKLFVPAFIFLALIAAGIILWRVLPAKKAVPPPSVSGMPTLAVLYFENKSGETKLDNWRDGLAELLIASISQSRYIRVVSGDEMYTILRRLGLADAPKYSSEDIEKIAAQTRATHVLKGSFITAGESFVITAGLQKLGTSESPATLRLEARNETEIIPKVDELTRQVKESLNLTAAQMASDIGKELGKITTSSPEAVKYYIEGRRFYEQVRYNQAIAFIEKAVELDPEFAMAYRTLALAHYNLGHRPEFSKYLKKALDLSARLPENERLFTEVQALYFIDENYAKAIEILERLVKAYPGGAYKEMLAIIYHVIGDNDRAIENSESALLYTKTARVVGNLAIFYTAKGLYQKAEDLCRAFLQDVDDNLRLRDILRCSYISRRQFELALAEAEKIYILNPAYKYRIGDVLLLKDDIPGAEISFMQVYEESRVSGRPYLYLLALVRGKYNEALALRKENLKESKGNRENEANAHRELADALATAGRYEDADKEFNQYLRVSAENRISAGESAPPYLPSQEKSDLFFKGRIQAIMGSFDEARKTAEELKALIEKGINIRELRYCEFVFGLIESRLKNYRQAADYFGRACGRLGFEIRGLFGGIWINEHAFYFDALARALYDSGDLDRARLECEKITLLTLGRYRYGDIYAKAYYMLGKIAEQQGDKARARENYQKFLDLWKDADPGLPEVEDAKKRLVGLQI